jgi:hypothetical protein
MRYIGTRWGLALSHFAIGAIATLGLTTGARAADTYALTTTVSVPPHGITCNFAESGFTDTSFFTFDISLIDAARGQYTLSDSSHGRPSSDTEGGLLSNATDGDVLLADVDNPSAGVTPMLPPQGDPFAGRRCDDNTSFGGVPATSASSPSRNELSGPNGALLVNDLEVWTGDGPSRFVPGQTNSATDYINDPCDSSVRVFSLITHQQTDHINLHGCFRTDEGTFDPVNEVVLIANPSEQPSVAAIDPHAHAVNHSAYINLISARDDRDVDAFATGSAAWNLPDHQNWDGIGHHQILKQINFDGTNGTIKADAGIEQTAYDRQTGMFYVAIPGTLEDPNDGWIVVVDPRPGHLDVVQNIPLPGCAPSGNWLGPNETLILGCGDYIFDIKTSTLVLQSTIGGPVGVACDETTYDAGSQNFGSACITTTSKGSFDLLIVNANTQTFTQALTVAPGAHSVAADPVTETFWLPAYQGVCGTGNACLAVFGLTSGP